MLPTWVFGAIPVALCVLAYLITCAVEYIREQRYLRAVFDGDRLQQWRADRHNARRVKHLAARHGRYFN